MSDSGSTPKGPKTGAWTGDAKYEFILHILLHFDALNKSVNWKKIDVPGRTPKSLQNMWTKVRAELSEIKDGKGAVDGGGESKGGGDFTPVNTPAKPAKKRAATPKSPKTPKKAKLEDDEDVKGDTDAGLDDEA